MIPTYQCANCNKQINKNDFIAIIGQAPAAGMSTPIGRADKLFHNVGQIYCADCVQSLGTESLVNRAKQPQQAERS